MAISNGEYYSLEQYLEENRPEPELIDWLVFAAFCPCLLFALWYQKRYP